MPQQPAPLSVAVQPAVASIASDGPIPISAF